MTTYYKQTRYATDVVGRKSGGREDAWNATVRQWVPTKWITDWMYGHDDFVDQITEEQARAFAPAAFTGGHQEEAMTTRYFTSEKYEPAALLRRVEFVDEAFVNGAWRPTKSIVDWMYGHDDFVDEITEDQARAFAPAAFT
ncbi:MAG TPA: hypothetical protein VIJ07_22575 [Dermatophilaceae bacterium]